SSDLLHPRGDLLVDRTGDDHEIRLPRRRPEDHPEPVEVVTGGTGRHHLDRAAGDPEEEVPQRRLPAPIDEAPEGNGDDAGELLVVDQTHRKTFFLKA